MRRSCATRWAGRPTREARATRLQAIQAGLTRYSIGVLWVEDFGRSRRMVSAILRSLEHSFGGSIRREADASKANQWRGHDDHQAVQGIDPEGSILGRQV